MDYIDDLEADFCAIYRIDNIYEMPGVKFLKFAVRVFAYDGVMSARMQNEMDQNGTNVKEITVAKPKNDKEELELLRKRGGGSITKVNDSTPSYLLERLKEG